MPATETEMQQAFAVNYVTNGGNATKAAIDAGYSAKSARVLGHRLVNNETVQTLIQRELGKLRYRSGTVGLNALNEIAEDPKAPQAARVAAARTLLEHAGLIGAGKDGALPVDPGGNVTDYNEFLSRMGQRRQAS
jgi:hypothetical protein